MKKVLVLGAGLVARPLVSYLLSQPDIHLTLADMDEHRVAQLLAGHARGSALRLDAADDDALGSAVAAADLVVSLLPWTMHVAVARHCLAHGRHLVTASYVKDEMRALDEEAREKGLIFLNEIGVDPGIDHMAAMRVIDGVKRKGGRVTSFYSYCGGLPSLAFNTNPLGYKFSWSPVGVMLAAGNPGRYLRDGMVMEIPPEKLFEHYWLLDVPGCGTFEAYVNRDALPYLEVYGIEGAQSMYRGTLRNIGHCTTWNDFKKLGLFDRERTFDFTRTSPRQVLAALVDSNGDDLAADVAAWLEYPAHHVTIKKLEWLGMFSDTPLPIPEGSVFDLFARVLQDKLVFGEGETDLLVQHHAFEAEYPDGRHEHITSTLIDNGIPHGDSAMARTVSLPVAIAVKLILRGDITRTGVVIPVWPDIYEPVLTELAELGISLVEVCGE